ncbi:MAG: hypothetical protein M1838_001841 [Thelocarpon superellum]|nr:MAG: hypothetical protein M1838_001841 [Thelocarpon superellum]
MALSIQSYIFMCFFTLIFAAQAVQAGSSALTCNPTATDGCAPDPGLGGTQSFDFRNGPSDAFTNIGAGAPTYGAGGVSLTAAKSGDSPTLVSRFYLMFGRVEIMMQAAPGSGIVSTALMLSDDYDEIDWEFLGRDGSMVQTTYFGKGVPVNASSSASDSLPVPTSQTGIHNYTLDWTADRIVWTVDGTAVVTRTTADAAGKLPQTPCQLRMGIWIAGDPKLNPSGKNGMCHLWREPWSGIADFADGPWTMLVQSVKVTDYSNGSYYAYGDNSGRWQSIQSVGGHINSSPVGNPASVVFVDPGTLSPSNSSSAPSSPTSSPTVTTMAPPGTSSTSLPPLSSDGDNAIATATLQISTLSAALPSALAGYVRSNAGSSSAIALSPSLSGGSSPMVGSFSTFEGGSPNPIFPPLGPMGPVLGATLLKGYSHGDGTPPISFSVGDLPSVSAVEAPYPGATATASGSSSLDVHSAANPRALWSAASPVLIFGTWWLCVALT